MPHFTDQTGHTTDIVTHPRRIISLVPSQTELLFHLGLEEEVIGITKFCERPDHWYKNKIRIGGTKNIRLHLIHQLKPDLIIANKEENVKEQVEELMKYYPVWISDVNTLADGLNMIGSVGTITGKSTRAARLIDTIKKNFEKLRNTCLNQNREMEVAYLIWKEPYMVAGGNTFIDNMLWHCSFRNVFEEIARYPSVTLTDIKEKRCNTLLLSSEPYPFCLKHINELQHELPDTRIILVDGQMFSWYGSRLLHAPGYFESVIQQILS
ncbi:MAG: helical backbone metal receptor [Chitinophagaceae bacterium]